MVVSTVTFTPGVSTGKSCYDGATAVTEKALGPGGGFRTFSHLLSHQHTQTGTDKTSRYRLCSRGELSERDACYRRVYIREQNIAVWDWMVLLRIDAKIP